MSEDAYKIIKDPVHGYISLTKSALSLVDTPEIQRLRGIRQLGFSYLVYPGANHTRFEHSLGSYHLADMLCNTLSIEGVERKNIHAAALLHDIGHGPFSHTSEEVVTSFGGPTHEEYAKKKMKDGILAPTIEEEEGLDFERLAELIDGEGSYGKIIASELDIDRMDYLMRDAHYTGVAYGLIDYEKLINEMDMDEGELIVEIGGLQAAESLLVSRFHMQPTVYFHHASRIAETMSALAIEKSFEKGIFSPTEFREMRDLESLLKMADVNGFIGEMAERILNRDLFKRAVVKRKDEVDMESLEKVNEDRKLRKEIELDIANECGLEHEVIIDIPPKPKIEEFQTKVRENGNVKKISETSKLIDSLNDARWDHWYFGVYCPEENRKKVKEVAKKELNI